MCGLILQLQWGKEYNMSETICLMVDVFMPDLNDFYAFKMTSSGGFSGGERNNSSNNSGGSGGSGCATALIVLAVIGWVLCLIGK